jgi:hypothetical protein
VSPATLETLANVMRVLSDSVIVVAPPPAPLVNIGCAVLNLEDRTAS